MNSREPSPPSQYFSFSVSKRSIGRCAALGLSVLLVACEKKEAPVAMPPPAVQVMTVQPQDAPQTQTWVTTLTADVNADIRAQVSGYLLSQNYRNGAYVKAGDLLFQIDPRPFQAALDQAQGTLAQSQATNTANELTAQRSADLYKKNVISRQQYDDQTQAYEASKAAVQSAQAAVEQAQLNLTFTRITSPVDGIASIANAQVGDLVGPSSGTLASVVKVNPIKVKFMVAEQDYVNFIQQFFKDPKNSPIATGHHPDFPLTLALADGTQYPVGGKLTSVNNVVGIETGSLTMEGEFPNPGYLLRPGQFGLVTATTHVQDNAFIVPQRAVMNLQGINQLAVVGADNKVQIRTVELGNTLGSDQVVVKGLAAGDRVVVDGLQKIKEGETVDPKPYTESPQEKSSDEAASSPSPTPMPTPKG